MGWWTVPIGIAKFAYDVASETKEAKAPEKKKPKTNIVVNIFFIIIHKININTSRVKNLDNYASLLIFMCNSLC